MAERKIVVIDAGHGGADPGAKFEGRQEKDDALRLALAVGKILSENGVDVRYTRTDDTYNTPLEKATMANEAGADYFVSIHRNAMPIPGSASGVMSLVFENKGVPAQLANNINEELANTGFANLGIIERPGLVVLRRTEMPAVLVEVGFIDNEADNQLFDDNFDANDPGRGSGAAGVLPDSDGSLPYPLSGRTADEHTAVPGIPGLYRQ